MAEYNILGRARGSRPRVEAEGRNREMESTLVFIDDRAKMTGSARGNWGSRGFLMAQLL